MRRPNNNGLNISSAHLNQSAAIGGAQNMLELLIAMFGPLKEWPEIVYVDALPDNSRAHYDADSNVIRIRKGVRAHRTLVHEYGHAYDLQGVLPDWARYAADVFHHVHVNHAEANEWEGFKLVGKVDAWELAWALHAGEDLPVNSIQVWHKKLKRTNMWEVLKYAKYLLRKEEIVARGIVCLWQAYNYPDCLYRRVIEVYAPDVEEILRGI